MKHLRCKKHVENKKQYEMIIPQGLFQEPTEIKKKKIYNPKPLVQIARDIFIIGDKQLIEELARKMFNPYDFTDPNLKVGFKINLDSHHFNHANSKLTFTPNYHFGFELRYFKKKIWKSYLSFRPG